MDRLLQALSSSQSPWRGVIHLWSLDAAAPQEICVETLQRAEALGCHSVMHFVQALARTDARPERPSLVLVTRRAQPLGDNRQTSAPIQSPLVGLGRVVLGEHPEIHCKLVDLDRDFIWDR